MRPARTPASVGRARINPTSGGREPHGSSGRARTEESWKPLGSTRRWLDEQKPEPETQTVDAPRAPPKRRRAERNPRSRSRPYRPGLRGTLGPAAERLDGSGVSKDGAARSGRQRTSYRLQPAACCSSTTDDTRPGGGGDTDDRHRRQLPTRAQHPRSDDRREPGNPGRHDGVPDAEPGAGPTKGGHRTRNRRSRNGAAAPSAPPTGWTPSRSGAGRRTGRGPSRRRAAPIRGGLQQEARPPAGR